MPDAIDTQNLYSKTLQVQRMQEQVQQQQNNEQKLFAEQMRRQAEQRLNQVQAPEESRMEKMEDHHPEEKGERQGQPREGQGGAEDAATGLSDKKESPDQFRGKLIDVEA
jgi:hypothetical protein